MLSGAPHACSSTSLLSLVSMAEGIRCAGGIRCRCDVSRFVSDNAVFNTGLRGKDAPKTHNVLHRIARHREEKDGAILEMRNEHRMTRDCLSCQMRPFKNFLASAATSGCRMNYMPSPRCAMTHVIPRPCYAYFREEGFRCPHIEPRSRVGGTGILCILFIHSTSPQVLISSAANHHDS